MAPTYTIKTLWIAIVLAVGLSLTIFGVVSQVQLHGMKFLLIEVEGWKPRAERFEADFKEMERASADAERLARVERNLQTQAYSDIAERIDENAAKNIRLELDSTERFIARQLRSQADRSQPCPTFTSSEDRSAGNGQAAGASTELDGTVDGPLVGVRPEDVRICTINTLQAEAAREWALQVEEANRRARERTEPRSGGEGAEN